MADLSLLLAQAGLTPEEITEIMALSSAERAQKLGDIGARAIQSGRQLDFFVLDQARAQIELSVKPPAIGQPWSTTGPAPAEEPTEDFSSLTPAQQTTYNDPYMYLGSHDPAISGAAWDRLAQLQRDAELNKLLIAMNATYEALTVAKRQVRRAGSASTGRPGTTGSQAATWDFEGNADYQQALAAHKAAKAAYNELKGSPVGFAPTPGMVSPWDPGYQAAVMAARNPQPTPTPEVQNPYLPLGPGLVAPVANPPVRSVPVSISPEAQDTVDDIARELLAKEQSMGEVAMLASTPLPGYRPIKLRPRT